MVQHMMKNLKIGPGKNAPNQVNVVIEIPKDSYIKYEIDKETGMLFVDRILYTSMIYPFNYGFIPGTLEEDGDPVDVLVLTYEPLIPGSVIIAKPIALLDTEDEEGIDSKVVAVPIPKIDPRFSNINDLKDLDTSLKNKIEHFFEHYKELEPGKWVKIRGWKGANEAIERIKKAIERYNSSSR